MTNKRIVDKHKIKSFRFFLNLGMKINIIDAISKNKIVTKEAVPKTLSK